MGYIRHDENNNPVSPQPGKITVTNLGGTTGWSTVTYENFNTGYVRHDEDCNPVASIGTYQRHDENNNPVGVGTYQRHDENNNPITG
tara:strand:- start:509 stop:769 length:261 start_codon:yes stop_codon:yes gene_type:complete